MPSRVYMLAVSVALYTEKRATHTAGKKESAVAIASFRNDARKTSRDRVADAQAFVDDSF